MVYCSNCGTELPVKDIKYCTDCGAAVKPDQQQYQSSQPNYHLEQRNYWNYGIFPVLSFVLVLITFVTFFANFTMMGGMASPIGGPPPVFFLLPVMIILSSLLSLIYIYYIYLNFEDFRKLQQNSHSYQSYPNPIEPVLGVITFFVFAPITFYLKYDQLYKHIKEQHKNSPKLPPNPLKFVFVSLSTFALPFIVFILVFQGLFNLIFIVTMTFIALVFIYMVKLENDWQNALNNHIDYHQG